MAATAAIQFPPLPTPTVQKVVYPAGARFRLLSINKRKWQKAVCTLNALNKLKQRTTPVRTDLCTCTEPKQVESAEESVVTYTQQQQYNTHKVKRSCFVLERSLWRFVDSGQWVDTIVISGGRLLDNIVYAIDKLLAEKKILVYKTLQYEQTSGENDSTKTVRRVTKEYYFPAKMVVSEETGDHSGAIMKAYKLRRNVNQWLERIIYRREHVEREHVTYLDQSVHEEEEGGVSGHTHPNKYFLPRMNEEFEEECFQGVRRFHIFKITTTDNETWKTQRQILVRRL